MVKLVLQRLGSGADDRLATAQQGRNQVGEGLSGPGPGLDHQLTRTLNGLGDGFRHPALAGTRLESGQQVF